MSPNPVREVWSEGRTAFGLWSAIPSSFSVELVASAGFDYVCVDQQHGVVDYTSMVPMLQAIGTAGAAPITRVLSNDPFRIMKSLDAGALGVIVPLVNNAVEAESAVAACRYPPYGNRSYGPIRAATVIGSRDPEDLAREVLCIVMVETREGLAKVEEIAAIPGLDGIYVGPADLALSLGLPPTTNVTEPEHAQAVSKIKEACQRHGIAAGIQAGSGEQARKYAEAGFNMVTVATDASLLRDAARREMITARSEYAEAERSGGYS